MLVCRRRRGVDGRLEERGEIISYEESAGDEGWL